MTTANVNIKKVLLRRGNTTQNDNYLGVYGEVSVDMEAKTLRIHDGNVAGGYTVTGVGGGSGTDDVLRANVGAYQTYANANAATQTVSINSVNANIGAYQIWSNANAATQTTSINSINANIGAYQTYANANAASQTTEINSLRANITAANSAITSLTSNAAVQAALLDTLTGNAATQSQVLDTLTSNASTQATTLSTLLSNAVAQQTSLIDLVSNAATQQNSIADLLANAVTQAQQIANSAGTYSNSNVKSYLSAFNGNLIPNANVTYSLGDATHQWKDLWVSNNTIYIGNTPIRVDGSTLLINGSPISSASIIGNLQINNNNNQLSFGPGESYSFLYMKNDGSETRLANDNGNVQISTIKQGPGGGTYYWTFSDLGHLALPFGSQLVTFDSNSVELTAGNGQNSYSGLTSYQNGNYIWVDDNGAYIGTNWSNSAKTWTFNTTGNITIPTEIIFGSSPAASSTGIIFGDGSFQNTAFTGPGDKLANQGYNVTLDSQGILYTNDIVSGGNVSLVGNLEIGGNITYSGNTWVFDAAGNLVLPGVQSPMIQSGHILNVKGIHGLTATSGARIDGFSSMSASTVSAANFTFANGVNILSTISVYGNTQVAAYLPTYTGNLSPSTLTLTSPGQLQFIDACASPLSVGAINSVGNISFSNGSYIAGTTGRAVLANVVSTSGFFWSNGSPYVPAVQADTGNVTFTDTTISTQGGAGQGIILNSSGSGEIAMMDYVGINNTNPGYWLHVGDGSIGAINNTGNISIDYNNGLDSSRASTIIGYAWWDTGGNGNNNRGIGAHRQFGIYKNDDLYTTKYLEIDLTSGNANLTNIAVTRVTSTSAQTGNLTITGNTVQQSAYYETYANVTNSGGNLTCNFVEGSTFYATLTANVTVNFTNVALTTGTIIGATVIVDQGATPYQISNVQVNGGGIQTVKWAGGVGQNPGTGSNTDVMSFSLINLNGTAWRVLGQIANYG